MNPLCLSPLTLLYANLFAIPVIWVDLPWLLKQWLFVGYASIPLGR